MGYALIFTDTKNGAAKETWETPQGKRTFLHRWMWQGTVARTTLHLHVVERGKERYFKRQGKPRSQNAEEQLVQKNMCGIYVSKKHAANLGVKKKV